MWQSKRLCGIVESVMAAETLIQVESAETCFWIAGLFNKILYNNPIITKCDTGHHKFMIPYNKYNPLKISNWGKKFPS